MHFASGQMCFTANKEVIRIEVAYAASEDQTLIELQVPIGTTVIEAIRLSRITEQYPEINLENSRKGIFSKFVDDDKELQEHDRVEIYRPLVLDPREARRQRAIKSTKSQI